MAQLEIRSFPDVMRSTKESNPDYVASLMQVMYEEAMNEVCFFFDIQKWFFKEGEKNLTRIDFLAEENQPRFELEYDDLCLLIGFLKGIKKSMEYQNHLKEIEKLTDKT